MLICVQLVDNCQGPEGSGEGNKGGKKGKGLVEEQI